MAKDHKKGNKPERLNEPITADVRFSSVHNDPRFKLPNLKNFKVKIDDRFNKKALEKLNAGATGKKVKIDRYGRKIKDSDEGKGKGLDKYYEHEEEKEESDSDESDEKSEKESDSSDHASESESEDESEIEDEKTKKEAILDRARGEGLASSDEDNTSSASSDSELESESEVDFEEESEIEFEENKPEEGDPTDTFAVVNMDWDNLRAIDLMATFLSFVPTGGSIKSVSIYPSEFGKEQMQKEEIEGPPRELFKSKKKKQEDSDSDDSDSEIDVNNAEDLERAAHKLYEEDNGEEDYDSKALRRYQLQRLRYYYAIVKCDSVSTAKNIYDNCDGTEYESTANIFDLRYAPEDMEFNDSDAKDLCTKIPSSYKPNSSFVTYALQHSKVKLTWDETPKERLTFASRQFSQKEIDEMDFKAYLASDSEESDNEGNDLKDKYKSLLGGNFGSSKGVEDDDDEVDMEITFNPGLDDSKAVESEKDQKEEESTITAYKRKEKERRKRRLEKLKKSQDEENKTKEEDAKSTKSNKSKSAAKSDKTDDVKNKAELELIMMDENENDSKPNHFNMRDIIKAEKQKKRKSKRNKRNIDSEMTQDNFQADFNDPRFKEIFENHDYAIDPTSSEFKKTATMKKILEERSKRHRNDANNNQSKKKQKKGPSSNGTSEVASLVDKLKRKHNKK